MDMASAANEKTRVDQELDDLIGDIARRHTDDDDNDGARQARAAAAVAEAARREREADAARARAEAEKARREAEAKAKAEAEAKAKAAEDARRREEQEAKAKAEKAKAEEAARLKAEQEAAKAREAEEARAEAEEKARREAEQKAEEEAQRKAKAEEEARLKAKAEEDARLKAQAEEEAQRKARAEEQARLKAEADAKVKADAEARAKAEQEARERAAEQARAKQEADAKAEADAGEREENSADKLAAAGVIGVLAAGAGSALNTQRMRGNLQDIPEEAESDGELDGSLSGKVIPINRNRPSPPERPSTPQVSVAEVTAPQETDLPSQDDKVAETGPVAATSDEERPEGEAAALAVTTVVTDEAEAPALVEDTEAPEGDKASSEVTSAAQIDDDADAEETAPAALVAMPYPAKVDPDELEGLAPPPAAWSDRRLLPPWLAMVLPIAAVSTVALATTLAAVFAPKPTDNSAGDTATSPVGTGGTTALASNEGETAEQTDAPESTSGSTSEPVAGEDGAADTRAAVAGSLSDPEETSATADVVPLQPDLAPPSRTQPANSEPANTSPTPRVTADAGRGTAATGDLTERASRSDTTSGDQATGEQGGGTEQASARPQPGGITGSSGTEPQAQPAGLGRRAETQTGPALNRGAGRQTASISLASLKLAPRPGRKPAGAVRVEPTVTTVEAPAAVTLAPPPQVVGPSGRIPVPVHLGRVEPGSAASVAAGLLAENGARLSKSEQRILAARLDANIDAMAVGETRSVAPLSDRAPVSVSINSSRTGARRYMLQRAEEVALVPNGLKISGGWYAVDGTNVRLRPTPSAATEMTGRPLRAGVLVESLGTINGDDGETWRLLGKRGVAIGYVADTDVRRAVAGDPGLGLPYNRAHGLRVQQDVVAETDCRIVDIGLGDGGVRRVETCRNFDGHWVSAQSGEQLTAAFDSEGALQLAAFAPAPSTADQPLEAAVLAMMGAQDISPIQIEAMADGLQTLLDVAGDGETVAHLAPGQGFIRLVPEDTSSVLDVVGVERAGWVGHLPTTLEVKSGWLTAPAGATLRPLPSHRTRTGHARIKPGMTVRQMAEVTDRHGADWTLVGNDGVAFGYVLAEEMAPLGPEGGVVYNVQTDVVKKDLVAAEMPCRKVRVEIGTGVDQLNSCMGGDGVWRIRGDDVQVRDFAGQSFSNAIF